jgi:hypothetical protein
MIEKSLLVWACAIEAGYAMPQDWIPWEDKKLLDINEPPIWIIELSVAKSKGEALAALSPAFRTIPDTSYEHLNRTSLYLGFLYLAYERSDLSLIDLLTTSGKAADNANVAIDCSAFYSLASQVESGCDHKSIAERTTSLFAPLKDTAIAEWNLCRNSA